MSQDQAVPARASSAAQTMFEAPKLTVDRMPVLHGVFDSLATACSESLRDICSAPASFVVEDIAAASSMEVLKAREDSIAGIFFSPELDARLLIGFGRPFIYALIDAMFGGDGSEPPFTKERPFTSLEQRIGRELADLAGEHLRQALSRVAPVSLVRERMEQRLEFATLGPKDLPSISARLAFQVMEFSGHMFCLIPQSALHVIRSSLEQKMVATQQPDPAWTSRFERRLIQSEVQVLATIDGPVLTLADIASLQRGQLIEFNPKAKDFVVLECAGERLCTAELGQSQGRFAAIACDTTVGAATSRLE